jgi:thioredoxin-like negative regulator of GroEL
MPVSLPNLLFFTTPSSGPARRMESLLAHLARRERERLQVTRIDLAATPALGEQLEVRKVPTLLLLKDGRPVARIEGRASAPEIDRMLAPHIASAA